MTTKRAKRLANYLEGVSGWTVADTRRICKCGHADYDDKHRWCAMCREKLPKPRPNSECLAELEDALAYALNPKAKMERP